MFIRVNVYIDILYYDEYGPSVLCTRSNGFYLLN